MHAALSTLMRGVARVLDGFFAIVAALGDLALLAMMLIMASEIVLRTFGLGTLVIADELSAALLVASTFLGLSIAVRQDALFRFDGLCRRIPAAWRPAYERLLLLLALLTTLVLARYLVKFVGSTYRRGTVSDGMIDYPLWIAQIIMPLGLFFLAVAIVEAMFRRSVAHEDRAHHV